MKVETRDGRTHVSLSGPLTVRSIQDTHDVLSRLPSDADLVVDLSSVTRLDTAGAWSLSTLKHRVLGGRRTLRAEGRPARRDGADRHGGTGAGDAGGGRSLRSVRSR
jgi:ABC-type transporter Mla MlaB component